MSHHDHNEALTAAAFFEEYWIVVLFGTFFLMTMFLPLLFLGNLAWLGWLGIISIALFVSLIYATIWVSGHIRKI